MFALFDKKINCCCDSRSYTDPESHSVTDRRRTDRQTTWWCQ